MHQGAKPGPHQTPTFHSMQRVWPVTIGECLVPGEWGACLKFKIIGHDICYAPTQPPRTFTVITVLHTKEYSIAHRRVLSRPWDRGFLQVRGVSSESAMFLVSQQCLLRVCGVSRESAVFLMSPQCFLRVRGVSRESTVFQVSPLTSLMYLGSSQSARGLVGSGLMGTFVEWLLILHEDWNH